MKKYYYIYKITNIITNKYYVGMHTSTSLDDNYFGSGLVIKRSIAKYGKKNHKKEIIEVCQGREELILRETEIVDQSFLNNPLTMNLCLGGKGGGWTKEQQQENNRRSQIRQKELREQDCDWTIRRSKASSAANLKAYKEGRRIPNTPDWTGKKHNEESKKKMSKSKRGNCGGSKNSQYGTCWIYNLGLNENKKVKKTDLNVWIDKGWIKGRKLRFYQQQGIIDIPMLE